MNEPLVRTQATNDVRTAILEAAERLFAARGFGAVALREIAREAKVNVGSVTYHFGHKLGLLEAIYARHTRPMNARRLELLGEARRIEDPDLRLMAILRAYLLPAFASQDDLSGSGVRFTRLRAVLSAEGDPGAREIIASAFDATTRQFIDAFAGCLPGASREDIVWRSQFLLGSLYYTLINPERIQRLSDGAIDPFDQEKAIGHIVGATFASLKSLAHPPANQ
ncbi:MAG: TetR family transcriptional regulator [Rhizobiaceae bacterium]|nr:TetR family transcriptional regulator [Rhizobiaceae bacterium]MCV0407569.1 TetR family transcriptional regulator [Rhizobiaceae bacterium]